MSSRLCIKNLPPSLSDGAFRKHFAQKGRVTDAKIVRRKDGTSRRFGFIGYEGVTQAEAAAKFFHRTYLGTCKIAVEAAVAYGSTDMARPWSRHSKGSSAYSRLHPEETAKAREEALLSQKKAEADSHDGGSAAAGTKGGETGKKGKLDDFLQLMTRPEKKARRYPPRQKVTAKHPAKTSAKTATARLRTRTITKRCLRHAALHSREDRQTPVTIVVVAVTVTAIATVIATRTR
jgi:multiple RNA-binding domain-containing protein 1